jgi:class 3 adenylate cyclase
VLHHGLVSVAASSLGELTLLGPQVIFAYRMEKLSGQMGLMRLMSDTAHDRLGLDSPCKHVGHHELNGFDGARQFYTF